MKKLSLLIVPFLFFICHTIAQPKEASITYDKFQIPGYTVEFPFSADVAEDAIKKNFSKMGVKGKERKGFWEFKNVQLREIREAHVDVYMKIDKKNRKKSNASILSMILTEPGIAPGAADSLVTAARKGNTEIAAIGAFGMLNSMNGNIEDHSLGLEILKQEEEVKEADKAYKRLVKEGEDLQDKLKKVQMDIAENNSMATKQAEELTKTKEALVQIQARRKIIPGTKN